MYYIYKYVNLHVHTYLCISYTICTIYTTLKCTHDLSKKYMA